MKTLPLILTAALALSTLPANADEKRDEKADPPRRDEAGSLRLPPKREGESEEARRKRLLELLKKRRESGRERPAESPEARRDREHRPEARRERERDARNSFEELEREIVAAKHAGRHEEAEKLMRRLRDMREHRAREERAHRERAERMRRELELAERERHHREFENPEEAERRMHHLREAAELLGAVGKREEAQRLMMEAESIERHLKARHREDERHGPSNAELAEAIERMQKQIHELYQAIDAIKAHLNQRR